jgi:CRP-like cAMP-binding protein
VEKAVAEMREVPLRPGDMLAEEGQTCWGMCVVESGTLDVFHYDASTEELANDPGPETALHLGEVGEGYITGEICTLFNTVHDATMIAGQRGCRLWGLSLFHYERAAGRVALTPGGCQIGDMEHTGCHQLNRVLAHTITW